MPLASSSGTKPVLIIAGPTAGGKSARAAAAAKARKGIVVNADSMQVYDALPMLTAQPNPAERSQAPHVLYGTLPPHEICSAQRWREMAAVEIAKTHVAGKLPIIVGGTGLYIKALTEGFSPVPDVPPAVRGLAVALQKELGNPGFHAELAQRDPVMAARLHPNDTQRLIRAWEVLEATGKSLAKWQATPPDGPPAPYDIEIELVMPPRDELYDRCDRRFDIMMENGVLDEAAAFQSLIDAGTIPADAPVTHALGFRPLQRHLKGDIPLSEAITLAKTETRQYAKRQTTWFRHQV
jgi:tRNA dimethylallyltransferase